MPPKKAAAPVAEPVIEAAPVVKEIEILSGSFMFPDNSSYTGKYIIDESGKEKLRKRQGEGVYTNGPERYSGSWENDQFHGQGVYNFASGAVYEGGFVNNFIEGEGSYLFPDGASYVGSWKSNKMHGQGTYTNKEGIKFSGKFFNGLYDSGSSYIELR